MQFERVSIVAVGLLLLQIAGQVDDLDGFKWAFLKTQLFISVQQKQRQLTYMNISNHKSVSVSNKLTATR